VLLRSRLTPRERAWRYTCARRCPMATTPRDPNKDQDPKPEPIDPPDDAPPVELPGEPMDRPNV